MAPSRAPSPGDDAARCRIQKLIDVTPEKKSGRVSGFHLMESRGGRLSTGVPLIDLRLVLYSEGERAQESRSPEGGGWSAPFTSRFTEAALVRRRSSAGGK